MPNVTGLTNFDALQTQNRMKEHAQNTSNAVAQLGSGRRINSAKDDSSGAAIAAQMQSDISVLSRTKLNSANAVSMTSVATGALDEQKNVLIALKTLATAATDGSLSNENRAMINNEFIQLRDQVDTIASSARWNGVSLMTGGAGTVAEAGAVVAANSGVVVGLANTFAANATAVTGFVSGAASEVGVSVSNAGTYDVKVKVGDQWFESKNFTVADGATMRLTSTTDSGAGFTLTLAADSSGIADVATFKTALETSLGLTGVTDNASFVSVSAAANNGLTNMTASSTSEAGLYAFRYDANSNKLTLTNGEQKWTQAVNVGGAQSVTFSNGISANLDNTFALGTSINQVVFKVDRTNEVSLNFQIGEKATDTLNVTIAGTTLAALDLSTVSAATEVDAQAASVKIDKALGIVNGAYSTLGAQQKRFDSVQSNLDTRIENLTAAKSKIQDADIAKAMTDYTVANTMSQISNVALSQSLQMTQQLLGIVRG